MTPERRIRTLRLAVPEESWIGRGAFLVEDALRTASLPWADAGRLLLVRTVDLGTIPAGAAPASVALALERRLREQTPAAVHATHPQAPRAAAVWFRDAAEAHVALARKLAKGEETAAWFWPLAVPAWKPGAPRGAALRAVLLGTLETPAGPAAVLEVVRALREVGGGGVDLLASALVPEDGPLLLRACGWGVAEEGESTLQAVSGTAALVLARWAGEWGRGDGRTVWLGAVLRAVEDASRGTDSLVPVLPGRPHPPTPSPIAPPSTGRGGAPSQEPSPPGPLSRPSVLPPRERGRKATAPVHEALVQKEGRGFPPLPVEGGAMGEGGQGGEVHGAPTPTEPSATRPPSPARGRGAGGEGLRAPETESSPLPPEKDFDQLNPVYEPFSALPSPYAGLLFLLPVLTRLNLATFLKDHPNLQETAFPARLLDHIARRLGAAEDDPIRRALPIPEDGERDEDEPHLKTWRIALRRWCRRRAGIGLASLVRRPGRVIATRTHIDIFFEPHLVEMRVRRAGLDLDPGWVPWLGRVVLFHYEQPPEVLDVG